jgi:hypothetical protein
VIRPEDEAPIARPSLRIIVIIVRKVILLRNNVIAVEDFLLCLSMLVRMVLVSEIGMLGYRFLMSREARVCCGSDGVSWRFLMMSWVFFMLKACGRGHS